jgi:hypothetical protein
MLIQNLIGFAILFLSILITSGFIGVHTSAFDRYSGWLSSGRRNIKLSLALSLVVFWMVLALSISVFIWAVLFYWLEEFGTFEKSLYFSLVSFTTLGFGDVLISDKWRLLSGIVAANGLILFSLVTAVLFEFISLLRGLDREKQIS